ncbi:MAG: tetratricopeptide repeat protein [Acidobacteria bacterium]|nr:tetratricopeptide repeat protein [Acidobacteriota bacterium]
MFQSIIGHLLLALDGEVSRYEPVDPLGTTCCVNVMFVVILCFLLLLTSRSGETMSRSLDVTTGGASLVGIERMIDARQLASAREQLKAEVAAHGETYQTHFLEARIQFGERRYEESLKQLERSFALHRQDARVYLLAGMNWVILERLDLARPFFETAVQLAPEDAMMHYHLGRYYYTAQRFAQAEQAFRAALKRNPESVRARDNLGLALEAQSKTEEAVAAYRKAIELAEAQKLNIEWPWLNLAKLLLDKNRFEESLALLEPALRMNPQSAEVFYVQGKVLQKLGRYAEAVAALQHSIRNDAKFSESHYLLGRLYLKQGRKLEAQREMEIFQELRRTSQKKAGVMASRMEP